MNKLLKYLIAIILLLIFSQGVESAGTSLKCLGVESSLSTDVVSPLLNEVDSVIDSDIDFYRGCFSSNAYRLQPPSKRLKQLYRFSFDFIKAGRAFHIGIDDYYSNKSLIPLPFVIKSVHKLISFGKLII